MNDYSKELKNLFRQSGLKNGRHSSDNGTDKNRVITEGCTRPVSPAGIIDNLN